MGKQVTKGHPLSVASHTRNATHTPIEQIADTYPPGKEVYGVMLPMAQCNPT